MAALHPRRKRYPVMQAAVPASRLPLKTSAGLELLDAVTVIDLTTSIAGPYAGQLLGDLGATVIKIERPGRGDDSRAWGPPFLDDISLWFLSVNRNKRGITLDIARPEGKALLLKLIAGTDVLLVNLPLRAQRKLGIDSAALAPIAPRLIHASITGFGLDGERADLPCYDLIAEGYSGVMDMTGEPDGPPQKVGTPAADLLAGEDAALAVVAALFRRERTGKGAAIDISMVESMTRFMAPRLVPYLGSGDPMRRSGGRDSVIAIYQAFDTADQPLTLGLGNDAIWMRFWEAVGERSAGEDPAHATNALRRADRKTLVARISQRLRSRGRDEWLAVFARARVPAGPIYRLEEIADDRVLHDRGFLYGVDHSGTRLPQVGLGINVDGRSETCSRLPLRLGADTASVLRERLGLATEQIAALEQAGII